MRRRRSIVVGLCLAVACLLGSSGALAAPVVAHPPGPRVLHGSPTDTARYPWQAELTISGRYLCGGVLISPQVVLTAAHCAVLAKSPSDVVVVLGRDRTKRGGVVESSASLVVDPAFEPHTLSGDWAYVVLASPASSEFTPLQIAGAAERSLWLPGVHAIATGYGTVSQGGALSRTLRQVRLPILPNAACARPGSYHHGFKPATMLCAGNPHTGRDTCQGDSGGPLVVKAPDGTYRLVGIVSSGRGCAKDNYPGIYTRIAGPVVLSALLAQLNSQPITAGYPYVGGSAS